MINSLFAEALMKWRACSPKPRRRKLECLHTEALAKVRARQDLNREALLRNT